MRKKREYKKRKQKIQQDQRMQPIVATAPLTSRPLPSQLGIPSYASLADVTTPAATPITTYSSDEDNLSPVIVALKFCF